MSISLFLIASTVPTSAAQESSLKYSVFCERIDQTAKWDKDKDECIKLTKLLIDAQAEATKQRNAANALLLNCRSLADEINNPDAISEFLAAMRVAEQPNAAKPDTIANNGVACQSDESSKKMRERLLESPRSDEFIRVREAFRLADSRATTSEAAVETGRARLADWQRDYKVGGKSLYAEAKNNPVIRGSTPEVVAIEHCDLTRSTTETSLLQRPNDCQDVALAWGDPLFRYKGGPSPTRPNRPKLESSVATGQAGSNAELVFSGQFYRFSTDFEGSGDGAHRQPKYASFSVGVEAKATDGIAELVGGNSDEANFLSRERLSSTFAVKGSAGLNFFPRETLKDFNGRRTKLLKVMRKVCEKSLRDNETKIKTDCQDANLIAWIYERDESNFKRLEQIENYEKLIWNSSADHPEFGFGMTGSFGLQNQDFYDFRGSNGSFDPQLVEIDPFFAKDETYVRFGQITDKANYTLGGYAYRHWPLKGISWLKGMTLRLDGTFKYDLEDIDDDDQTTICRKDLSSIGSDDVFDASDQCRTVLAYQPSFETTFIPKLTVRLATDGFWSLSELGFAPNFSMELRKNERDLKRLDVPVFFTLKDENLTSGLGVAHEWDPAKTKNQSATTVYIFVGKKFSLDGSK